MADSPISDKKKAGARSNKRIWFTVVAVWSLAVLASVYSLVAYAHREGLQGKPPNAEKIGLVLSKENYTLLMSVHPHCPCTRASIYELEKILAKYQSKIFCQILVYSPQKVDKSWAKEYLVQIKNRLPGAKIVLDPDGRLAASLKSKTSGAVVMYDSQGNPKFWGGITPSRGHAGDNLGSDAIAAIVSGGTTKNVTASVFGCELTGADGVGAVKDFEAGCCAGGQGGN